MSIKHWLILLLLAGGALRLWQLGDKSFWVDEISAVYYSKELSSIVPYCQEHNTPPLRYFLIHYLARSPRPEAMTRLPSALCGILSLPLLFLLVCRLFDRRVALIAVALLAFSPWHIYHSQDGRMYAVFLFLVLLSLHLLFLALDKNKLRYWALLGLVFGLNALLTHFGLWVAFYILVFLLILLPVRCWQDRMLAKQAEQIVNDDAANSSKAAGSSAGALTKGIIICYLAAALGYSPWIANLDLLFNQYSPPPETQLATPLSAPDVPQPTAEAPPAQSPPQIIRLNPFLTDYNWGYFRELLEDFSCSNRPVSYALGIFFLIGCTLCYWSNRRFLLLALVWIGGLCLILLLKESIRFFFPSRYLIYMHLMFIIMAALGLWRCAEAVGGAASRLLPRCADWLKHERLAIALSGLLISVFALAFMADAIQYHRQEKQDWRSAVSYLSAIAQPGDAVITGQAWTNLAVAHYYTEEMTPLRFFLNHLELHLFQKTLEDNDRLWFINWGPLPERAQPIIDHFLVLDKTFPGRDGNIELYRKKDAPDRQGLPPGSPLALSKE